MASLINREAWHVGAVLSYGKIVNHSLSANAVTIHRGIAFGDITVHSGSVILNIDKAIQEAEEQADYWLCAVERLKEEQARRDSRKPEWRSKGCL